MNKIQFIISKIKRYGIFGVWKYIFIKYSSEFFYKNSFRKFIIIKREDFKIYFSKTNVAKALYLFPNLHDGDVYEVKELLDLCKNEKNKDLIFVDIGANIGTITLPIAKYIQDNGKVFSIEAHPKTYFELLRNIKLNKLRNVETFQVAIGDKNGIVNFSNEQFDDMNHVLKNNLNQNTLSVPMFTLDTLLHDLKEIDVLKIDVEGYEKFLLENATETLEKTKTIYMEYFEQNCLDFGYKREDLKKILEKVGFICNLSNPNIHQNPGIDNLICINTKLFKS